MKVYILCCECVYEMDTEVDELTVYESKENAIEAFNETVNRMKKDMSKIYDTEEETDHDDAFEFFKSYCAYSQGYYCENHIEVNLLEREVL